MSRPELLLPPVLRSFAETHLGALLRARFCSWEHAESAVWQLSAADGRRAFLKAHRQPRKFKQELHAYQAWLPGLGAFVPELVAVHEVPCALLLSAVPGTLVQEAALTPEGEGKLYRQAGALLRGLHDQPFEDRDPVPLAEALRRRSRAWSERARGLVEDELVGWVRAQAALAVDRVAREALVRVPCHRDYTPRNWMVDLRAAPRLYVIDFEHARPDLWLHDLLKLSEGWPSRPDLKAAFFSGYGGRLTALEHSLLRQLAALHALSTVVWAREHGDAAFEAQGRRLLERLQTVGEKLGDL